MIIFWRGLGILVPIIVIAVFIGLPMGVTSILGSSPLSGSEMILVSTGVSAALIVLLGYWMNYKTRVVETDSHTGKVFKSPSHTFFFIPIEYWAVILVLLVAALEYASTK